MKDNLHVLKKAKEIIDIVRLEEQLQARLQQLQVQKQECVKQLNDLEARQRQHQAPGSAKGRSPDADKPEVAHAAHKG